jgi:hypothetical protein
MDNYASHVQACLKQREFERRIQDLKDQHAAEMKSLVEELEAEAHPAELRDERLEGELASRSRMSFCRAKWRLRPK